MEKYLIRLNRYDNIMVEDNIGKEELLDKLQEFSNFDKLRFVYLYGSFSSGKETERSDIDICLYYDIDDKQELYDTLIKISGSFPERYDFQMFQLLPLYVQKEVFKGDLLYAEDKGFVHDIARETVKDYNDFEPRYKYILYGKAGVEGAEI